MADPSFDVVSEIDEQEIRNAVDQAQREIVNRFDFKNTGTEIALGDKTITLTSSTEDRLAAAYVVLTEKIVKRKVSLKVLDTGAVQPAGGNTYRQVCTLQAGIDKENAKKVTGLVKDSKLKVQAQVQGDQVRITGKKKDDLQAVMNLLREADLPIPLQFTNFR